MEEVHAVRDSLKAVLARALPILQHIPTAGGQVFLFAGSALSMERKAWIQHDDDVDFTVLVYLNQLQSTN